MFRLLFVLLAFFLCLSTAHAQTSAEVMSDQYTVKVEIVQSVPRWTYYNNDNSSYTYQVSLFGIWEIENLTSYDVVPMTTQTVFTGWVVSDATDIAGDDAKLVQVSAKDPSNNMGSLSFNTRIPLSPSNDSSYPVAKFNVSITGYKWTSDSSTAQLVVAFNIDSTHNELVQQKPNVSTHGSKTVDFGNAYFHINSTASAGASLNTTVSATLKRQEDAVMNVATGDNSHPNAANVFIIYEHFDDSLEHDPEIGFGEGPGNNYIWIIIIVVIVVAVVVIIAIAVIGFVLVRRRRRSYDAF